MMMMQGKEIGSTKALDTGSQRRWQLSYVVKSQKTPVWLCMLCVGAVVVCL